MSDHVAERQECYECSACKKTFSTERGRDSHVDQVHGRPYHDEEFLREQYVERGRSSMDIADQFGVSYKAIINSLRRNSIPVRSTEESHRRKAPDQLRDGDKLRELYHGEGLSGHKIAERVGVTQPTVALWMHRHGIEARGRGLAGEDNPRWCEDSESLYYGANWYEQSRAARDRDGNTCQVCGHSPGGKNLDVHHIQPLRTFDEPEQANRLGNLITLCRPCHRKWEGIPLRPEVADD